MPDRPSKVRFTGANPFQCAVAIAAANQSVAPAFSSKRCSFAVPGIVAIHGYLRYGLLGRRS